MLYFLPMGESLFWRSQVRPQLSLFGVVKRIENTLELGTPDVTFCLRRSRSNYAVAGWIELKAVPLWPTREATKLALRKFTIEQICWLESWSAAGGTCCVLAQIEKDFLLVPGARCRPLRSGLTRAEWLAHAEIADNIFPTGRIIQWLTQ